GQGELRASMYKARAAFLALAVPAVCILAVFGSHIIRFLYDARYWEAGWMLQILSVGVVGSMVSVTADRAMLATGDSAGYFRLQMVRSLLFITGIIGGYAYAGLPGFLVGVSCARLLDYLPLAFFLSRRGVWLPKLDLPVLALAAVAIISG